MPIDGKRKVRPPPPLPFLPDVEQTLARPRVPSTLGRMHTTPAAKQTHSKLRRRAGPPAEQQRSRQCKHGVLPHPIHRSSIPFKDSSLLIPPSLPPPSPLHPPSLPPRPPLPYSSLLLSTPPSPPTPFPNLPSCLPSSSSPPPSHPLPGPAPPHSLPGPSGELFTDYDEFIDTLFSYQSRQWTCCLTGKSGMTFEEAMLCEGKAQRKVDEAFPDIFVEPLCRMVHLSQVLSPSCRSMMPALPRALALMQVQAKASTRRA